MSSPIELGFHTKATELAASLRPEIEGHNVIITGPSPGSLGWQAAKVIAANGRNLIVLAGRDQKKLDESTASIKKEIPSANIRTLILDLSSFEASRRAANELIDSGDKFHVLINSAGAMGLPYKKTIDGYESHFAANHLGHFIFTVLLLNSRTLIPFSGTHPVRIASITAHAHMYTPVRFGDYNFKDGEEYDPFLGYGQSKTANILFAVELTRRGKDKGVVAWGVVPGVIPTNLTKTWVGAPHVNLKKARELGMPLKDDGTLDGNTVVFKSIDEGAATYIHAAFHPSILSDPGTFLNNCQVQVPQVGQPVPAQWALDPEQAKKLWEESERITGVKAEF